jgi:hypothetical protein
MISKKSAKIKTSLEIIKIFNFEPPFIIKKKAFKKKI